MTSDRSQHVTLLLDRIKAGDDSATGELLNAAYADLRRLAAEMFKEENAGHTLQPTALVNEVCIRMLDAPPRTWEDRTHFFRSAAKAMRHLLTDSARARNAACRGGGVPDLQSRKRVSLESLQVASESSRVDLLALEESISRLAAMDERLGIVFELRFLAGLNVEQTALVAGIAPRTVEQDSRFIRAWLHRELAP
jgi:RNA polymerase sigma factor (TIGR02999 family)